MKIKTSILIGGALNWAVIVAEGLESDVRWLSCALWDHMLEEWVDYSTDGSRSMPIIERELILLDGVNIVGPRNWSARICKRHLGESDIIANGHTALIAAMRCHVINKLGNEIEIPSEILY